MLVYQRVAKLEHAGANGTLNSLPSPASKPVQYMKGHGRTSMISNTAHQGVYLLRLGRVGVPMGLGHCFKKNCRKP